MTAQQKIAGRILAIRAEYIVATGDEAGAVRFAFNKVLGPAAFECLASDLHDALTARAA